MKGTYCEKIVFEIYYIRCHSGKGEQSMKIYNALDVANFIIDRFTKKKDPVSNLRLQKLLYFVWVEFYRETKRSLFVDSMYAWPFGPVVPDVYYEYCSYGGRPINLLCDNEITPEDAQIIEEILQEYQTIPVNKLVEKTHRPGTPWYEIFDNGKGDKNVIPFNLIKNDIGE